MLLKVIGWVLGIASIAIAGQFFDKGEFLSGMLCVLAIGFLIPPMREKLNKSMAKKKGNNSAELTPKQGVIGGVIIIIVAGIIGAQTEPLTEEQQLTAREKECSNTMSPMFYAQEVVKQNLKSPATAEFPFYDKSQIQHLGDCVYQVRSYVDYQNSFGAIIRSSFYVRIKRGKTENDWQIQNIEIH